LDKKHGKGTYIWADGRKYVGMWQNGKQHGDGAYYDANGTAKSGIWDNGKRVKWLNDNNNASDPSEQKAEDAQQTN